MARHIKVGFWDGDSGLRAKCRWNAVIVHVHQHVLGFPYIFKSLHPDAFPHGAPATQQLSKTLKDKQRASQWY